jgi:hypothetical protein
MKLGAVVNILSSALLLAAPVLARESTDVIVMENGDRITCEVKGLSGLVAGGPPGKQAVVPCESGGRLGIQGDPQHR